MNAAGLLPPLRAAGATGPDALSAEAAVVQAQLQAYNAHDVEALLRCYSVEAQQFEYPDRLIAQGHAALRERMRQRFVDARPVATLLHRTALGSLVIDHERIVGQSAGGPRVRELIGLYEVGLSPLPEDAEAGQPSMRILRARFVFGDERPA